MLVLNLIWWLSNEQNLEFPLNKQVVNSSAQHLIFELFGLALYLTDANKNAKAK